MTRLSRSRNGKTSVDVTVVRQDDLTRVRLTMGDDSPGRKNTDLDSVEVEALALLLVTAYKDAWGADDVDADTDGS